MNTHSKLLIAALALGLGAAPTFAQDDASPPARGNRPQPGEGAGPGGARGQRPMMMSPLIAALDANHDGVIDETEIANASKTLKTLDKNGDGKLTMAEIRPTRPEGVGGPGGPGGPGAGRGLGGSPQGGASERPSRPAPEQ